MLKFLKRLSYIRDRFEGDNYMITISVIPVLLPKRKTKRIFGSEVGISVLLHLWGSV